MELIVAQCKAILCPRIQLTIYRLIAASAQDTFCYDKEKSGNEAYGVIKPKKVTVLSHRQKYYRKKENAVK